MLSNDVKLIEFVVDCLRVHLSKINKQIGFAMCFISIQLRMIKINRNEFNDKRTPNEVTRQHFKLLHTVIAAC